MKRWLWIPALLCCAAGCRHEVETSLWQQNKALSEEKTELKLAIERLQEENYTLTEQVKTLAGMDRTLRLTGLVAPVAVRVGRYSGFYDKSDRGSANCLMLYLTPLDAQQDAIKAAGTVQAELWDLSADPSVARLASWQVDAEALKTQWAKTVLDSYYRIPLPLDNLAVPAQRELTLRVQFTDYLTGRVLTAQHLLERKETPRVQD